MAVEVITTEGESVVVERGTRWHVDDADHLHVIADKAENSRVNQRPENVACFSRGTWASVYVATSSAGPFPDNTNQGEQHG